MGVPRKQRTSTHQPRCFLAAGAAITILALLFVAAPVRAEDVVHLVLGTGSGTGAVATSHPSATGTGAWFQVTGKGDLTYITVQVKGLASNTINLEASMDGTNTDVVLNLTVDKKLYTTPACGGCLYRVVAATYVSGTPIVMASASGTAQVAVQ